MSAWDVSTAKYFTDLEVDSQGTSPYGVFLGDSGSELYVAIINADAICQYSLSTPYDLSTASYTGEFDTTTQEPSFPTGIFLKGDGTKMYLIGFNQTVFQYSLSPAWDITSASYDSKSVDISGQVGTSSVISFSDDGSRMYAVTGAGAYVYQYDLSTAWDVSSATYDDSFQETSSSRDSIYGIFIRNNGIDMYLTFDDVGVADDKVYHYTLSTPWDVTTAAYNNSYDFGMVNYNVRGIAFSSDGERFYVVRYNADDVLQYNMPWLEVGTKYPLPAFEIT